MATFITKSFLKKISKDGRILDGLRVLDSLSVDEIAALPSLPKLTSWECILEEVIDTDHDPEYYARFANELLKRGYSRDDISSMRLIAWETAGWFNFEMMAWDWCHLSESDMVLGLKNRLKTGNIDRNRYKELKAKIKRYRNPPNIGLQRTPNGAH